MSKEKKLAKKLAKAAKNHAGASKRELAEIKQVKLAKKAAKQAKKLAAANAAHAKVAAEVKAARRREREQREDYLNKLWHTDPREALIAGPDFVLSDVKRDATPGWTGTEAEGEELMSHRGELMAELQERLFAERKQSLLVVVQGLDTAGKGGIARHVISQVDPQGVLLSSFKVPTEEERQHDFLWRIRKRLPEPGFIGLFDRSHYEDLLVPTVNRTLSPDALAERYNQIAEFEKELTQQGTVIVKLALIVSYVEQGYRMLARVDRFDKHWKYSANDLRVREQWQQYQAAYDEVLRHSSTDIAPWYVLPADNKWFARLAATEIITRTLAQMNPQWPAATFDPQVERARVEATLTTEAIARYENEIGAEVARAVRANERVEKYAQYLTEQDERAAAQASQIAALGKGGAVAHHEAEAEGSQQ